MNITISGYTTTRNCSEMNYPFEESIKSVLSFADEVVVLDTSDGRDDTLERLQTLASLNENLRVVHSDDFDWSKPNHGIFDGQTKALSRSLCKSQFLYQFDVDEIVHELDGQKIRPLIERENYLRACPLMALPVIEYWGSSGKVRMDINPWKPRLSRNLPGITHGIPIHLRREINGLPYASPGTDTCDYIFLSSGTCVPVLNFITTDVESLRQAALENPNLVRRYEGWFNQMVENLPGVHHYSWFSLERKIRQYKLFWTTFWKAMYGPEMETSDPEWNPFFELPWSEVTDQMIKDKARELSQKTGGHIFHSRWNGKVTPSIKVNRNHPEVIQEWVGRNKE